VKKYLAVLLIIAGVFASYAPALRDGFVWDDTALILRDPLIRSWRLIPEAFNHFLFVDATASDFYRPLQRLTYTLDYAAFAFRSGPYHAASILWHAAAAIALFVFAEEVLLAFGIERRKRLWIAFLAVLVWAIHPVESAAVAYVSGRADPLAATFGFFGLYLFLLSLRAIGQRKLFFLFGAGVALLLSALSKETGLIFLAIGIAFFVLKKNWIDMCKAVAVAAFVCAIYFSLRSAAEHIPPPALSAPAPSLVRPIIVARAVAEYGGLILLPLHLHMDRDVETHPSGFNQASLSGAARRELQTLLGIVLIAAVTYWMVRARKRNPAAFACLLFAVISYLPISGIVALNASVAEHWIYLPSAFFFLAAAVEVGAFLENRERPRTSTIKLGALLLFIVWLAFLGARTFIRTFDWKDQRTFLERTIVSGGDSARMLINLGDLELRRTAASICCVCGWRRGPDHRIGRSRNATSKCWTKVARPRRRLPNCNPVCALNGTGPKAGNCSASYLQKLDEKRRLPKPSLGPMLTTCIWPRTPARFDTSKNALPNDSLSVG
jgi:hypothetical protein